MQQSRDWTPRLNGDIFCSPACGHNCTKADHDRAQFKAQRLAAALGPGWVPEVWENLGWYYAARKGTCAVHPAGYSRWGFVVYLNIPTGQIVTDGTHPRKLVKFAIREARRRMAKTEKLLRAIQI